MKKLLLSSFFVLTAACGSSSDSPATSESSVNGVPVGEVRGVADVSSTLRIRLLDDADPRSASFDVSRVSGASIFGLRRHLGVFVQSGTQTEYQGGTPTPFSMALWHQVLGRIADASGATCEAAPPDGGSSSGGSSGSTSGGAPAPSAGEILFPVYATASPFGGASVAPAAFRLRADAAQKIAAACTFEQPRDAASALWDAVMGRGATLAGEKAAFDATFTAEPFVSMPPKARVSSMMLAIMLNPHFLLRK